MIRVFRVHSRLERTPWHAEGNADYGFDVDWLAVFCAGAEEIADIAQEDTEARLRLNQELQAAKCR